ncbi:response regulator transcription factor [Fulvivirgaceae bacterium BMA12]|uniref:Response regulator transcription factor n=1 Tax=Agaribacillus aureus TaxID=3051825 RepID=A0ABT8LAW2_9BACT|nr:response regulator transcription factor [Fulvivirgaceae bacterium BMA12]
MKTRCLIVDDEPIAIEVIKSHLRHFETIEITATAGNAVKAVEILNRQQIDLMFLDIQMPQITGLDFLRSLSHPPGVIITTAFRDYALVGYELDVVDYLLKPVSFERFLKAIQKYFKQEGTKKNHLPSLTAPKSPAQYIFIRADRKTIKLPLQKIIFIESLKDYVKIHTDQKVVITKEQISQLEARLSPHQFMRIHRSFIIATDRIEAFSHEGIEVEGKTLPIGRSYKNSVMNRLYL